MMPAPAYVADVGPRALPISVSPASTSPGCADTSLDEFLHARPRILHAKLEVLAAEIMERFRIRDLNLVRIDDDTVRLREMISGMTLAAGYGLRQHGDKGPLYQVLFELRKQEREQDSDCWKDVVGVMRDFLLVWEAHQQARARAALLQEPDAAG